MPKSSSCETNQISLKHFYSSWWMWKVKIFSKYLFLCLDIFNSNGFAFPQVFLLGQNLVKGMIVQMIVQMPGMQTIGMDLVGRGWRRPLEVPYLSDRSSLWALRLICVLWERTVNYSPNPCPTTPHPTYMVPHTCHGPGAASLGYPFPSPSHRYL